MNFQDNFSNSSKNFTAKKSLGQNFLHAPQVISAMVHSAQIVHGDTVLEAGPGKGALTEKLLEAGAKVIAVEKDDRAIPFLSEKFKEEIEKGKLEIIHEDILEFDILGHGLMQGKYKIVANIPYYISGEFIRKFLETDAQPQRMVIMLQKELAKRITDEKGSILAISVKAYGNPKYITSVPRKFFRPMPNVDSAVLLIENISKNFFKEGLESSKIGWKDGQIDEKTFFEIIKAGFAHKRKVLIKNLEEKLSSRELKSIWEKEKWLPTARAQELSLKDWKKIACCPQK